MRNSLIPQILFLRILIIQIIHLDILINLIICKTSLMKKGTPAPPAPTGKVAAQQPKTKAVPQNKPFSADEYVTLTLPREEVIDIRQAFEIFDSDGSGIMDPAELKQAFIDLGFTGQNKFVYQILAELDEDQSGGIDFPEFLRLATAKIGEKDNRAEINKVFNAFDPNRSVLTIFYSGQIHNFGTQKGRPRSRRRFD